MKALITGASSGIGYDITKYLSSLGYDVIIVARRLNKLEELASHLKTDVRIINTDLSSEENCIHLYYMLKNENIDILVNNAGFGEFGEFWNTNLEKELDMINVNIKCVHILTKLFLKDMREKNHGYILNVSSLASFVPGPLMSTYYATKSYITRLTQGIYKELQEDNSKVVISALCPGPVNTEFNDIANVEFKVKYLSSEYVSKYAINKLFKRKLIINPGMRNKFAHLLSKISPDKLSMLVSYNIQKKKRAY